jgi:hypothetical protein
LGWIGSGAPEQHHHQQQPVKGLCAGVFQARRRPACTAATALCWPVMHSHILFCCCCCCVCCCSDRRAKYQLQHVVRTNLAASDAAYGCVFETEDESGVRGVKLSKELMSVAGALCGALCVHCGCIGLQVTEGEGEGVGLWCLGQIGAAAGGCWVSRVSGAQHTSGSSLNPCHTL